MNLILEKMNTNHLKILSDNLYSDFDDFWTIESFKLELENPNTYYVIAKLNEEIVGFGGIYQILDEMQLNYIVTKKNKRNLGIASQILDNLISFANNKNIALITLEVNENNKNAIKLYEKFGFRKIGLRKKYYNNKDNAILMELKFYKT